VVNVRDEAEFDELKRKAQMGEGIKETDLEEGRNKAGLSE
jgi:hypothetical protein